MNKFGNDYLENLNRKIALERSIPKHEQNKQLDSRESSFVSDDNGVNNDQSESRHELEDSLLEDQESIKFIDHEHLQQSIRMLKSELQDRLT